MWCISTLICQDCYNTFLQCMCVNLHSVCVCVCVCVWVCVWIYICYAGCYIGFITTCQFGKVKCKFDLKKHCLKSEWHFYLPKKEKESYSFVLRVICPRYTFTLPDSGNCYFLVFQSACPNLTFTCPNLTFTCPNLTFTCPGQSGKCLCSTLMNGRSRMKTTLELRPFCSLIPWNCYLGIH